MAYYRRCRPEILLIIAGLLVRLAFASLPLSALLALLEDDAWMVAAIARHWALGHGITADGLTPTNGFHPLYPLTLGALPYLFRPDDLDFGFRVNLLICALLNGLALVPFYGLARLLASRPVALAGLAVLAINPLFVRVSVNAMETSLALLLLLALWWYALARPPTHWRSAALMGALAALAGLARLDNLLAAGMLGLALLWREARARRLPTLSMAYGLTAGVLLAPYFARNLLVFGALSPSSGRALAYLHSYRESFAFSSGLQLVAYQPALDLYSWDAPQWLLALTILALGAMVWSLARAARALLLPLFGYALALTFYYSYLQQQGQPRYYVGVGVIVLLLACAWADRRRMADRQAADIGAAATDHFRSRWLRLRGRWSPVVAIPAAIVLFNGALFARSVDEIARAPYLAQPAMYEAARWIAANLPPDARLASSNSGIFQYYSGHVVINFDGKLNHEIIPVLERRELDAYLRRKGVAYIVDLPPGVENYVEFYSSRLSEAPAHAEISSLGKLQIYGRLIANKLRLGPPVLLDERVPDRVVRPFAKASIVVRRFSLPNDPARAVTLYQLAPDFGQ